MLDARQSLERVFADGEMDEFGDHEDSFHAANSFNFIVMQVEDLKFLEGVHPGPGGDLRDVIVGEIQFDDVDAAVNEFEFVADDIVARQHQDLQLLGSHNLLVEEDVVLVLRLLLFDVQWA